MSFAAWGLAFIVFELVFGTIVGKVLKHRVQASYRDVQAADRPLSEVPR